MRSGGRVVEGARLESEYTSKAYRGFESLPLRQACFRGNSQPSGTLRICEIFRCHEIALIRHDLRQSMSDVRANVRVGKGSQGPGVLCGGLTRLSRQALPLLQSKNCPQPPGASLASAGGERQGQTLSLFSRAPGRPQSIQPAKSLTVFSIFVLPCCPQIARSLIGPMD